jgi:hypothetical protein
MSTQIAGRHIPAVLFNLEDVISAARDTERGWVLTTATREEIASEPEHADTVAAFLQEHFFHANANLWINPALIIGLFDQGEEIILNGGHGLLTYDARQVDVGDLMGWAGLTQVTPHAYVQLKVASSLDTGHLLYGKGDAIEIPDPFADLLSLSLPAQGWVRYKEILLNPARLLIRDAETISDEAGSQYDWSGFGPLARAAINALPWETRGGRQINPQALAAVEPFKTLQTPKIASMARELLTV